MSGRDLPRPHCSLRRRRRRAERALRLLVLVYIVARNELRGRVDQALAQRAADISKRGLRLVQTANGQPYLALRPEFGEAGGYVQLVQSDGSTLVPLYQNLALPIDSGVRAVARDFQPAYWSDLSVDGTHLRVFTFAFGLDEAVQVARPLTEVDRSLDRIGVVLIFIARAGIAIAAGLGSSSHARHCRRCGG